MLQYSKLNSKNAMETRNHLKNGASLKSLTSKRNNVTIIKTITLALFIMFSTTACASGNSSNSRLIGVWELEQGQGQGSNLDFLLRGSGGYNFLVFFDDGVFCAHIEREGRSPDTPIVGNYSINDGILLLNFHNRQYGGTHRGHSLARFEVSGNTLTLTSFCGRSSVTLKRAR